MRSCPFYLCFQRWISQQQHHIEELLKARTEDAENEDKLRFVTQKNIKHYQDYYRYRIHLTQHDPLSSFSPIWFTSFHNSLLWIGGCRPSLAIQLLYTLCGLELDAHLTDFLRGVRSGNLGELTASQLNLVNHLHCTTVTQEEEISTRLTSLQEDVGDEMLLVPSRDSESGDPVGELNRRVSRALDWHSLALARVMQEADELRLNTVKELIKILTPLQAVDFLVEAKKIHLSMIEWA